MKINTCKGSFIGTIWDCANWLEMMQPSTVSVEAQFNNETANVDVLTPRGMESGWQNTRQLRDAIRAAWDEGRVECGDVLEDC